MVSLTGKADARAMSDKKLLQEALQIISAFIDGEYCPLHTNRRDGESCRDAFSRIQGVPCRGCNQCEAREFLRRVVKNRSDVAEYRKLKRKAKKALNV